MKTKRTNAQTLAAGLLAIAVVALAAIGCKQDASPTPETPDTSVISGVQVYTTGLDSKTATEAKALLKKVYEGLTPKYKNTLSGKITKIYILAGSTESLYSFDKTTGILKVGSDFDEDTIAEIFIYSVIPALS